MPISAVALFGSRARGDQTAASDTDLLMVTEDGCEPRHSSMGSVSLSFYARDDLARRAALGDLFVWHVLFEGRPLYDPGREFAALRDAFRLRTSYAREIAHGAALGWLLARFGPSFRSSSLAARRATWAVRSILIARSAEQGQPQFAAARLIELAPIAETPRLLQLKGDDGLSDSAVDDLRRFLEWTGLPNPAPRACAAKDFTGAFAETGNEVGQHFLESLSGRLAHPDYP